MKRVLTIAGSDSGGGAGIQADLKTFSAFGVYGMSVLTAVTAQNTVRVNGVEGISAKFVGLQFESVLSDIGIDGIKTGMLFSTEIVQVVSLKLLESSIPFIVVDPVMVAKGGEILLDDTGLESMKTNLIPQSTLLTPNIPEAEALAGIQISSLKDMQHAAEKILRIGCKAVLIKGGHLRGDAVDLLFNGDQFFKYTSERIPTRNTHGTGCTYSAAILANLVKGKSLREAIRISKHFITEAIRNALSLGKGCGPLNHFVSVEDMD
jgi:hydroxymethylpyrimidine/phosphomethylpyrimidine kinase